MGAPVVSQLPVDAAGDLAPVQWAQTIAVAYVEYLGEDLEFLAEGWNLNNQADGSAWGRSDNFAAYAHLGYRVSESLVPYAQVERAWLDGADREWQVTSGPASPDPYYSRTRSIIGLRWELAPNHATVKFELRRDHKEAGPGLAASEAQEFLTNFSFGF
jgi:hypothetical protein